MPKLESLSTGSGRREGRRARAGRVTTSLAEINVVPLVDVMLVLLVIFMVAAPMMQQGFNVQLPQAKHAQAINEHVTVTVPATYRKDGVVRIGQDPVKAANLAERVRQALAQLPAGDREILFLRTFEGLTNQEAAIVLDLDSGTASKRYGRAILRLHQILKTHGLTESSR
jgi:biopolymer transport protein ExbD